MDEVSITIIGAGVIGLAIAAELSREYDGVAVLERNERFGQETSSRNSEVIHAGIYYSHGSLKATLCVEGARLLYEFAENHAIPYRRIGKLIVASAPDELRRLQELYDNGLENGVEGLRILEKRQALEMEPAVIAEAALHSPNTGIIDSHSLMSVLHTRVESSGALFSFGSEVELIDKTAGGFIIGLKQDGYRFRTRIVINAAGLSADRMASLAGVDIDSAGYRLDYCKGSYFSYSGISPVTRLVYPVPHQGLAGLGVHATLDLAGRLRFGPDVEYTGCIEYGVDEEKRDTFYEGASRIISGLRKDFFMPDMAGVRPKLKGPGIRDFVIAHESDKGLDGLINLVGIESPGLTASLAIAKRVAGMVKEISA